MALIVQKFGGTSVADDKCLKNVATIVTDTYKDKNSVVVVVSAQGNSTNQLIESALALNPDPSKRELDMLLSCGEQMSASLLAMTIENLGFPVISLTGWQAGFKTDSNHSNARIRDLDVERIKSEIDQKKIVIVSGFQGINMYNDITTLGRGGSDTTAVALAVELKADICKIYTDVDGVYTADPRYVSTAKKLSEISYEEMLELASLGAKVLHNRSVELAQKYNVTLEVLSSITNVPGTIVKELNKMEKMIVKGITSSDDVARITVVGITDNIDMPFKIFSFLSQKNISVDIIIQSIGANGKKDLSFTIPLSEKNITYKIISENLDVFQAENIDIDDNVSKLSIVGSGMQTNPGVASKMFEALYESGTKVLMISTSEIKISVLIPREDTNRALKYVHDAFI